MQPPLSAFQTLAALFGTLPPLKLVTWDNSLEIFPPEIAPSKENLNLTLTHTRDQGRLILTTQTWKQTSGDPSGLTRNYRGIALLYNFMTALLYMVSSVTIARIVAWLLNIY